MANTVTRIRSSSEEAHSKPALLSDDAVARACGGRDPQAVAELFHRFHPMVTRYLRYLVQGDSEIEDLVQSTFLEIARGNATYDAARGNVTTWLRGIATHVARHHRRSTARRFRLMKAVAWAAPTTSTGGVQGSAEQTLQARQELLLAQNALHSLSTELREAYVLCELEGVSAQNASGILECSEATVWKRVSRARQVILQRVKELPLRKQPLKESPCTG